MIPISFIKFFTPKIMNAIMKYVFEKNEERSKIRIIDPTFLQEFASKFESLINE